MNIHFKKQNCRAVEEGLTGMDERGENGLWTHYIHVWNRFTKNHNLKRSTMIIKMIYTVQKHKNYWPVFIWILFENSFKNFIIQ